jgi:hypothetical protein
MAMRETVRSLKLYFIVSALLGGAVNVSALLRDEPGVSSAISVIGIGFALAYLYVGVRLRQLLSTAPGHITKLLMTGAVFLLILLALDLLSGMGSGTLPQVIVGLLITWYLFVNVRRLAAESRSNVTAQPG